VWALPKLASLLTLGLLKAPQEGTELKATSLVLELSYLVGRLAIVILNLWYVAAFDTLALGYLGLTNWCTELVFAASVL